MVILVIAYNTFRETIRDRVLINIFFFALSMIGIVLIVSQWSLEQEYKILLDFGLSIISLFGLLVAIFIGIGLIYKEIDRRTIYIILAKPIKRSEFVIGKFFGMALTLLILIAVMGGIFYCILYVWNNNPPMILGVAYGLLYLESLTVMAIALLFSCLTTPMLGALMSIFLYIIGHLSNDIRLLGSGIKSELFAYLLKVLYYLLPNLQRFDISAEVVHELPLPSGTIILSGGYGLIYITFLIFLATIILNQRDFQ